MKNIWLTSHRLNRTHGWKLVSSNILGFMNDIERSGMPDNLTTQSIWGKILYIYKIIFWLKFKFKVAYWLVVISKFLVFKCLINYLTYISMNLGRDCRSWLVYDGVDLFDDVEVSLVVGVLHARTTPRNVRQLAGRKGITHTEKKKLPVVDES